MIASLAKWRRLWVCGVGLFVCVGCQRHMTIKQAPYINTARLWDQPRDSGYPLEVNVVVVTAKDLKNPVNDRLRPGGGITSDIWYSHRPQQNDRWDLPELVTGRFQLPSSQIYLYTNERQYYGEHRGPALRGSVTDGRSEVKLSIKSGGSCVYVFPKFIGRDHNVLPVPPAIFDPPRGDLTVEIGVHEGGAYDGQFIRAVPR